MQYILMGEKENNLMFGSRFGFAIKCKVHVMKAHITVRVYAPLIEPEDPANFHEEKPSLEQMTVELITYLLEAEKKKSLYERKKVFLLNNRSMFHAGESRERISHRITEKGISF